MYEKILRDLRRGVSFTSSASTTPNPIKLSALLDYILSNTSKLPALCISLEKKIQSTLPRRGIFGFRSAGEVLLRTTLSQIRECEFYINILRAILSNCKALGIVSKISDVVIRVIVLLLQQSHEEYLKLFYHLSLELFDSKEAIDSSPLVTPIIKLCEAELQTAWSIEDRQRRSLHALSCLIKACISRPGTLELSFDGIFSTIVEFLDIDSFNQHTILKIPQEASIAEISLSDLSLACFDRLAAASSISSLIALLNTMISYFDHYGWSHGDIIVELFVRLDMVSLQHRHMLPTLSHLIAHANYIATNELAENISKAERAVHPHHQHSDRGVSSDLSQPSPVAAEYIQSILQIVTVVIEREAQMIIDLSTKSQGLRDLVTYADTNKCFHYLTHILWMCIVWKTFHINSMGKSQAHDIILSTIEYRNGTPQLQLLTPFDSDDYTFDDVENRRNPMIDILKLVWECIFYLSKYRFPNDITRYQAIPSLFQVLHEKVQALVPSPGVRLDLLIPAKNAMFIFVLHAISIVLAENVSTLTENTNGCTTALTGNLACELALLLRSRSWQTQRLAITVLYQLFSAHKYQQVDRLNDFSNEGTDSWSPYDDRLICVLRDGIFNALCTQYSHQAHSVAALFKLQVVILTAFGEDELLASLPMILALEEFWSIFISIGNNSNAKSSSSAASTSSAVSSIPPSAESYENSAEMLRCQRWYFLAFFFYLSRVYVSKELQTYVMQQIASWGKKNLLSQYLAMDSVNAVLIIDHEAATSAAKQSNLNEMTVKRINRHELVSILLQSSRLTNLVPSSSIEDAFNAVYHPQEDPFSRLQELHSTENISKTLFTDDHHGVDDTYAYVKS